MYFSQFLTMFLRQQAVAVEPAVEQAIENVPHSAISVAVLQVRLAVNCTTRSFSLTSS